MKWSAFSGWPRLLAACALGLTLLPALLAYRMYRDAVAKDERIFHATAEVLAGQLQARFQQHLFLPGDVRRRAGALPDDALAAGQLVTTFDWHSRLPHLAALAYLQPQGDELRVQWAEGAAGATNPATVRVGDDLASQPAVAEALRRVTAEQPLLTVGCRTAGGQLLMLVPIASPGQSPAARGYVAAWLDLAGFCQDESLSLIRDRVLKLTLLERPGSAPPDSYPVRFREGELAWEAAVSRGFRFADHYGAPTPWLSFAVTGLGAVPVLLLAGLAGRAGRLQAELAAEREVMQQHRYFAQSVSHEFRTPLGVIRSAADLLADYSERLPAERRRQILDEIQDNTDLMAEMVEQVLLLGRLESGRCGLRAGPVQLADLCRAAADKVTKASGQPGRIAVEAPATEVLLDAGLVNSMLENLLGNALKYSLPDTPVTLRAEVAPRRIRLTVGDRGMGVPADELPRLGEPFHRGRNVGDRPGTGLGLAIVRASVQLHGGTLAFSSREGAGTEVGLSLPQP